MHYAKATRFLLNFIRVVHATRTEAAPQSTPQQQQQRKHAVKERGRMREREKEREREAIVSRDAFGENAS